MTRADLAVQIGCLCADLGEDELKVILSIAQRLTMGAKQYGVLDMERDPRDWHKETYEELCDAVVYSTLKCVRVRGG